ncbi:MAG: TolC family protein [Saprospiraceae bacterium]|jgi:outer membrane protein TolC
MNNRIVFMKYIALMISFHLLATVNYGQISLTLEDAVKTAIENNFNIRIAQNNAVIQGVNNTRGNAGMLPDVALNFGQTFNINNTKQELANGEIRQGNGAQSRNLNANVQANWTVFDGMRMFVTKDRLEQIENFGKINLQLQIENTISDVMSTYYAIEHQMRRIETIHQAIGISRDRLALAKLKKEAGTGSGIPVLQAEVDINADSSNLINQEMVLKNLKINLNRLMATDADNDFKVMATQDISVPNIQDIVIMANQRNKQLMLSEKNIEISKLTIKQWQTNQYPTLDINLGYNFTRMNAEIGLIKFNQNAGINYGLTGRWNIFNGWNNKREIQVAKLNLETEKLNKENLSAQLEADIYTLYNEYVNAQLISGQEDKNISVAQQTLDITNERMRFGTINDLELRQAQLNVTEAQFRKIQASYTAKIAMLALNRLAGGLSPN